MIAKGTVRRSIERTTTTGKPYWSYQIGDQWFTAWENMGWQEGQTVQCEYKERVSQVNGQNYTNRNIVPAKPEDKFKVELAKIHQKLDLILNQLNGKQEAYERPGHENQVGPDEEVPMPEELPF